MYCKNCGVELEEGILICPLCGRPAGDKVSPDLSPAYGRQSFRVPAKMTGPQKRFTWEIISIILLSSAIATFIVDYILNHRISWSEFPLAICLTVFCYVSLFAFWDQSTIIVMIGGLILSSVCLVILDLFTDGIQWSLKLGIPLLLAANLVVVALLAIIRKSKYKGINLLAYAFLAAALLCISVDSIISFFRTGHIQIKWSVIVAACTIPVIIVLLFVHFRLKKGRSLKRTFHV